MENQSGRQAGARSNDVEVLLKSELILASASPRRAEILASVGWRFRTLPVDVDESLLEGEGPVPYVERLAREKALAAASQITAGVVLGADTTVVVDEHILAKPADEEDARRMLRMLAGRWHDVLTGVAVVRAGDERTVRVAHERTRVRFGEVNEAEVEWHVRHGATLDKAGAYAVQGLAALFIKEIQGDYWNVVGLPIHRVYTMIREIGEN